MDPAIAQSNVKMKTKRAPKPPNPFTGEIEKEGGKEKSALADSTDDMGVSLEDHQGLFGLNSPCSVSVYYIYMYMHLLGDISVWHLKNFQEYSYDLFFVEGAECTRSD